MSVKYEPLRQTARHWAGQSKQEIYLGKRTSKRLSLTLDRGHVGRIHEVLQEDGRSSMYKSYDCIIARMKKIAMSFCNMVHVFYYDYSVSAS